MASSDFRPYAQWDSPERIVLNLSTLFRLWTGEAPAPPTFGRRARAFADAGKLLRERTR
jgi:hypothetical protein